VKRVLILGLEIFLIGFTVVANPVSFYEELEAGTLIYDSNLSDFLIDPASNNCAASSSRMASAQCSTNPSDVPRFIDSMATVENCHEPGLDCYFEFMTYKDSCLHEAIPFISPQLRRSGKSANQCVAWAVRDAVTGNKWRSIAWLALGACPDGCVRKTMNDHKKVAYDYMMRNYVSAWKHVGPSPDGNTEAQAMKCCADYADDNLEDCVENDSLSELYIPPGLAVIVCDDETGPEDDDNRCKMLGAGIHGPGDLGDLHDEVNFIRVFRP
jgi:hypothetical protein